MNLIRIVFSCLLLHVDCVFYFSNFEICKSVYLRAMGVSSIWRQLSYYLRWCYRKSHQSRDRKSRDRNPFRKYALRMRNRKLSNILPSGGFHRKWCQSCDRIPVRKYVLRMRNRKLCNIRPSGAFSPQVTSD